MPMTLAIPFPAMDPVLISLGPLEIRWYALAYIGGILLGWWYAVRLTRQTELYGGQKPSINGPMFDDFIIVATLGIVLGGRLGYVLFYKPEYFLQNPSEILAIWEGGMAFHGGLLAVVFGVIGFGWYKRVSVPTLADLCCAAAPIGLFFGRIANFINGELWGRPTDMPWGVIFPFPDDLARHPSQLYQAFLEGICLFIILRILTHRFHAMRQPGAVCGVFFIGYGIARLIGEQFREPDAHLGYLLGPITMGMVLSVPMILFGMGVLIWTFRYGRFRPEGGFPETVRTSDTST